VRGEQGSDTTGPEPFTLTELAHSPSLRKTKMRRYLSCSGSATKNCSSSPSLWPSSSFSVAGL
jgi:hypothetical protein